MRTRLTLAAGTAALALVGSVFAASPAMAACDPLTGDCADTVVTFELTGGGLSIAAQPTADLGTSAAGTGATVFTGNLGATTVTDTRGAVLGLYTVVMTSSDFVTGGASGTETVLGATVTGAAGTVTHTNASAVDTPALSIPTLPTGSALLFSSTFPGTDEATYNPTVNVPVPATNAAGVYTGTITQTVI